MTPRAITELSRSLLKRSPSFEDPLAQLHNSLRFTPTRYPQSFSLFGHTETETAVAVVALWTCCQASYYSLRRRFHKPPRTPGPLTTGDYKHTTVSPSGHSILQHIIPQSPSLGWLGRTASEMGQMSPRAWPDEGTNKTRLKAPPLSCKMLVLFHDY